MVGSANALIRLQRLSLSPLLPYAAGQARAMSAAAAPGLLDPRTGKAPRLPLLQREDCTPEQAEIFDRVTSTRKSLAEGPGGLPGPWNAMLFSTKIGGLMEKMGDECRNTETYKTYPNVIEIGICMVGVDWISQFEVYAHYKMARDAGVSEAMIAALEAQVPASAAETIDPATPAEKAAYAFGREFLDTKRVSDGRYARLEAEIGQQGVVELVHTMGHYHNVCMTLNAFNVPLPDGVPLPFAEPPDPSAAAATAPSE